MKAFGSLLILLVASCISSGAASCRLPTGLDENCPADSTTCKHPSYFDKLDTLDVTLGIPGSSVFFTAIQTALSVSPGLLGVETPIQNHWTSCAMIAGYGCAAAYHPTALELFGRTGISDDRRRCAPISEGEPDLWDRHRKVALFYTLFWAISESPTTTDPPNGIELALRDMAKRLGINFDICDDLDNCDDISTPWGLAKILVDEMKDFCWRDGWNRDGSLSGNNNMVPYKDWRSKPYHPLNPPWVLLDKTRWQPLREHDGQGFIYWQEHVTPHIGETAISIFLGDKDICARTNALENPDYDLDAEAKLALERTRKLDDATKAEIEFFDNKLTSLLPLSIQMFLRMGLDLDSFESIQIDTLNLFALREATVVVWRAKTEHDLIRPTNFIQSKYYNNEVVSYGGPDIRGEATLFGQDWQPYIRVMPHSEFPSGSACLCRTFADTIVEMLGTSDVTQLTDDEGPLIETIKANTSRVEFGKPEQDVTLFYTSWDDIVKRCSETRIEGGMHFTASIHAGEELCAGIGNKVAQAFKDLKDGKVPDYVIDPITTKVKEQRKCAKGRKGGKKGKMTYLNGNQ